MQIWFDFLKTQKNELGENTVKKWLLPLKIIKFDACNLYLQAPDSFYISWFEEYIRPKLKNRFVNNNNHPIKVFISIDIPSKKETQKPFTYNKIEFFEDKLDKTKTFSTFCENENKSLAFRLLSEISGYSIKEKNTVPPTDLGSFNPILIYGPSGSGKTHLLMATAHALKQVHKNVFYVSAKSFTQHVVNAFRLGNLQEFRNTYRKQSILLIDDVHEFANKTATQEEFFHTFNTLHTQNSQIILTSNLPPSHLKNIEPRLISRFEWGISLSQELPSQTQLKVILDKKITCLDLNISTETKAFLLEKFNTTISLQKALEALILRIDDNVKISLKEVYRALQDLLEEQKIEFSLSSEVIISAVAKYFGIKVEDILGKAQTKECSFPRQIAMFLCREKLRLAYKKIGNLFNRDHSTVMSNIKFIELKKSKKIKIFFIRF